MYERILAPVDIQRNSSWERTLPVAVGFARMFNAELNVLTVVPDIFSGMDWRYAIRGETGGSQNYDLKDLLLQAQARLTEICGEGVPGDLSPNILIRSGNPFEQILETTTDLDVDLIVMTACRMSLKGYLLGPTTSRVVRHADCSVHVVRHVSAEWPLVLTFWSAGQKGKAVSRRTEEYFASPEIGSAGFNGHVGPGDRSECGLPHPTIPSASQNTDERCP